METDLRRNNGILKMGKQEDFTSDADSLDALLRATTVPASGTISNSSNAAAPTSTQAAKRSAVNPMPSSSDAERVPIKVTVIKYMAHADWPPKNNQWNDERLLVSSDAVLVDSTQSYEFLLDTTRKVIERCQRHYFPDEFFTSNIWPYRTGANRPGTAMGTIEVKWGGDWVCVSKGNWTALKTFLIRDGRTGGIWGEMRMRYILVPCVAVAPPAETRPATAMPSSPRRSHVSASVIDGIKHDEKSSMFPEFDEMRSPPAYYDADLGEERRGRRRRRPSTDSGFSGLLRSWFSNHA